MPFALVSFVFEFIPYVEPYPLQIVFYWVPPLTLARFNKKDIDMCLKGHDEGIVSVANIVKNASTEVGNI